MWQNVFRSPFIAFSSSSSSSLVPELSSLRTLVTQAMLGAGSILWSRKGHKSNQMLVVLLPQALSHHQPLLSAQISGSRCVHSTAQSPALFSSLLFPESGHPSAGSLLRTSLDTPIPYFPPNWVQAVLGLFVCLAASPCMSSASTHTVCNLCPYCFGLFHGLVLFHCADIPLFVYPCIHRGRWFSSFDCGWCCYGHVFTG